MKFFDSAIGQRRKRKFSYEWSALMFHYINLCTCCCTFSRVERNSVFCFECVALLSFLRFSHFPAFISCYVPYVHLCFSRSVERNDEDLAASFREVVSRSVSQTKGEKASVVVLVLFLFFLLFLFWRTID